jgi:hypothetical protein
MLSKSCCGPAHSLLAFQLQSGHEASGMPKAGCTTMSLTVLLLLLMLFM